MTYIDKPFSTLIIEKMHGIFDDKIKEKEVFLAYNNSSTNGLFAMKIAKKIVDFIKEKYLDYRQI